MLIPIAFFLAAVAPVNRHHIAPPIAHTVRKVLGVWVHVVTVDLTDENVKVSGVTSRRIGSSEPVWRLVSRAKPAVAMTGTFHSLGTRLPVGDIVIDGECVIRGDLPSCLAIDWFGKPKVLSPGWQKRQNWRDYEYLLGGGIRVLRAGRVGPDVSHRRDRHILLPNPRTAAGITRGKKLVLVATRERITLSRLGKIMKALGARDAISLDGGSSVCLYYEGKMLVASKRRLTNLLVVYDRAAVYRARKAILGPTRQKSARR